MKENRILREQQYEERRRQDQEEELAKFVEQNKRHKEERTRQVSMLFCM